MEVQAIALNPEILRQALKGPLKAFTAYIQFIVYKLAPSKNRPGKNEKLPVNHANPRGKYVNCLDTKFWTDHESAINSAIKAGPEFGVGFVFTSQDPFWCLDIDDCLEPCGTKWSPLAIELTAKLNGAAIEVSSSRKGLHVFGKGTALSHKCKNKTLKIELYTEKHFIALTGINAIGDANYDTSQTLADIITQHFTPNSGTSREPHSINGTLQERWDAQVKSGIHPDWIGPTDNTTLIEKMLNAHSPKIFSGSASFGDLWKNNTAKISEKYGDNLSSADAALAQHLAWWTGNDCARMLELMLQSQLKREKWERDDYLPRTILFACSNQNTFYNEHYKSNAIMDAPTPRLQKIIQRNEYPELNLQATKPLNTYGNLKYMLNRLGITVRWNDMSRRREVSFPNFPVFFDDQENSALLEITNLATLNNMPTSKIDEHLTSLAQNNHYHPIVECIKSLPWDRIPRLDSFIKTLKTTNDQLSYKLLRRWMLSAIAAAFSEKGFATQGVLVLQGKQNVGKTSWVKSLDPIDCYAVKEGALLDPTNKDSIITLSSHWIVELGELDATFRKSEIARIKSHITNQIDEVRVPYARRNSQYARRTAYIATVNESRFLIDDTGNRRWWTIEVESIVEKHGLDMQQVWAEVFHLWNSGEKPWLTQDELNQLNESNIEHEQIDPFEEKVISCFDWCDGWQNNDTLSLTASDVLKEIGYMNPTKSEATRMGKILTKLTGKKAVRRYHAIPRKKLYHSANTLNTCKK